MSPLSRVLTVLPVMAFALTAAAGTLGLPIQGGDPISSAPAATTVAFGVPTNGSDPVSAPAIFADPLGF